MEEGNLGIEDTWFKGKVYSRRSKKTPIIDLEKGKAVLGETSLEDSDIDDCQRVDDQQLHLCQSSEDSSSANFESDNEAILSIGPNMEEEQKQQEENGFEGFRCLMESQMGDENISKRTEIVDTKQILIRGQQTEILEDFDQELQGINSIEEGPQIKVGKMRITSSQINEAAGALALKVIKRN